MRRLWHLLAFAVLACGGLTIPESPGPEDSGSADATNDSSPSLSLDGSGWELDGATANLPDAGVPVAYDPICSDRPVVDCTAGDFVQLLWDLWGSCGDGACHAACGWLTVEYDGDGCALGFGIDHHDPEVESCLAERLAASRWPCAPAGTVSTSLPCPGAAC